MSEVNLAASPAATVVAGFLVSADPPPQCAVYHGVLTPIELDVRPKEIEALISRSRRPRSGLAAPRCRARERPFSLAQRNGHQHGERLRAQARRLEPGVERAGTNPGRPDGLARQRRPGAGNRRRSGREASRAPRPLHHHGRCGTDPGGGCDGHRSGGAESRRSAGAAGIAGAWPSP